jgi:hypothetical protein
LNHFAATITAGGVVWFIAFIGEPARFPAAPCWPYVYFVFHMRRGWQPEAPTKMKLLAMGEVVSHHFLLSDRLRYPTTNSQNQGYVRLA